MAEVNSRLGGLPRPVEAQDIWEDIWHLEAHHSTAIEGNTLVMKEVQALLDQGRAVGAKTLGEYNEVRGYADAARWVYQQALEPGEIWAGQCATASLCNPRCQRHWPPSTTGSSVFTHSSTETDALAG